MATTRTKREAGTFGEALRRCRLMACLSQGALAQRAGLSIEAVSLLERGRRAPRPETVKLLIAALAPAGAETVRLIAAAFPVGVPAQDTATAQAAPHVGGTVSTHAGGTVSTPAQGSNTAAPSALPAVPAADARAVLPTLPLASTPLVGREREEADVAHLLGRQAVRLLTLTGPGGVGKTRLAVQVAAGLADRFDGDVTFVDLAPLGEAERLLPIIARALGLREAGAQAVLDLLTASLRERRSLLVLDNCEHLLPAMPQLVPLLAACPHLRILATSRVALRLCGEHRYPVPPLALPPRDSSAAPASLRQVPAVDLFVQRAQAVSHDFALSADNAGAVVELCRRLDGVPLAIELAAARVGVLSPEALLRTYLAAPLRALGGGMRDMPARQQSVRATLDWSYGLLLPAEQALFACLGVFVGGCTLEAIAAVYAEGDIPAALTDNVPGTRAGDEIEVGEGVQTLLEHSLLQRRGADPDGTPRFGLLETVRAYARERLDERADAPAVYRRHALYYLALAEAACAAAGRPDEAALLQRLERDHDNLRAVLRRALDGAATDPACNDLAWRTARAAWRLWYKHGHLREGQDWLAAVLAQPKGVAPETRAAVLRAAAVLAVDADDLAHAEALAAEGLDLYRDLGDQAGSAAMLVTQGNAVREQGGYVRAQALYEQALALFHDLSDTLGVAVALNNLGTVARYRGDLARAAALYEQSLDLRRQLGDRFGLALTLQWLGEVARAQGEGARAASLYRESLDLRRALGDQVGSARALMGLAALARESGQAHDASVLYGEILALYRSTGAESMLHTALHGLSALAAMVGDPRRAARLAGAAAGGPPHDRPSEDDTTLAARERLGAQDFAAEWQRGRLLSLQEVYHEALDAVRWAEQAAAHPVEQAARGAKWPPPLPRQGEGVGGEGRASLN